MVGRNVAGFQGGRPRGRVKTGKTLRPSALTRNVAGEGRAREEGRIAEWEPELTPAEGIIRGRTLPVGAVPARLLRSAEYSIRETLDLNRKDSLCGSRTLKTRLAATGYSSLMPVTTPAMKV